MMDRTDPGRGRLLLGSFRSASLGVMKRYTVYLPPGYDEADERCSVLYLFRGHEREWANAHEDGSRGGATVVGLLDAQGHARLLVPAGGEGSFRAGVDSEHLTELGLDPERVEMFNIPGPDGAGFAAAAGAFAERIEALGPSPVRRADADPRRLTDARR